LLVESNPLLAAFDRCEYAAEAPLFKRLSEQFELCVFGLDLVRSDLERLQRSYYEGLRSALGS
jgi:hypothetical protein